MNTGTISFHELVASDGGLNLDTDAIDDIRHVAEIIMAVDATTGERFLLYGRELLQEIVANGKGRTVKQLLIECDFDTDELCQLVWLVDSLRGFVRRWPRPLPHWRNRPIRPRPISQIRCY